MGFLMSFMDLIPVDLLPRAAEAMGASHFRAVPTADLNQTLLCHYRCSFNLLYSIKMKGLRGLHQRSIHTSVRHLVLSHQHYFSCD